MNSSFKYSIFQGMGGWGLGRIKLSVDKHNTDSTACLLFWTQAQIAASAAMRPEGKYVQTPPRLRQCCLMFMNSTLLLKRYDHTWKGIWKSHQMKGFNRLPEEMMWRMMTMMIDSPYVFFFTSLRSSVLRPHLYANIPRLELLYATQKQLGAIWHLVIYVS